MAGIVKLEHKAEFRALLANYQVTPGARKLFNQLRFVVVNGPAGAGRNAVINYLVDNYGYFFIISDTTRPPKVRDGKLEQDGVQYWFRSEEDMLADIRAARFLEAELIHNQQVSGISLRELERAAKADKTAIAEVEFGGANKIASINPQSYIVGLVPPSYTEWMRRLRGREEIAEIEFYNRLQTSRKVLSNMTEKPYFRIVVNHTIEQCAEHIRQIVDGTYSREHESQGRKIAKDILNQVEIELRQAGKL